MDDGAIFPSLMVLFLLMIGLVRVFRQHWTKLDQRNPLLLCILHLKQNLGSKIGISSGPDSCSGNLWYPGQLPGPVPNIILIVIITLPLAPQPYPWRQYWPSQWGCFGNRSPDTPEYLVKKVQMRFLLQNWKENVIFHSILVIKLTLNCVSLWFPQQELHLSPLHKECGHYHPSPRGTWVQLIYRMIFSLVPSDIEGVFFFTGTPK